MMRIKNSKLSEMMCLDVYLMSLPSQIDTELLDSIRPTAACYSLLSLDVLGMHLQQIKASMLKEREYIALLGLAEKFRWQLDLQKMLATDYSALVVTNLHQQILWVNKGFSEMSGYSKPYALGRQPSFLQGKQTCAQTRKRIREQLAERVCFTEKVINYRKTGEIYLCQITINPIINLQGELTHFIALEKEILL